MLMFVSSRNVLAARTTKFSSPPGNEVLSQEKSIPLGCFSMLSSSHNAIGAISVSISWNPSGRLPRILSERLILAGAKTCITGISIVMSSGVETSLIVFNFAQNDNGARQHHRGPRPRMEHRLPVCAAGGVVLRRVRDSPGQSLGGRTSQRPVFRLSQ